MTSVNLEFSLYYVAESIAHYVLLISTGEREDWEVEEMSKEILSMTIKILFVKIEEQHDLEPESYGGHYFLTFFAIKLLFNCKIAISIRHMVQLFMILALRLQN